MVTNGNFSPEAISAQITSETETQANIVALKVMLALTAPEAPDKSGGQSPNLSCPGMIRLFHWQLSSRRYHSNFGLQGHPWSALDNSFLAKRSKSRALSHRLADSGLERGGQNHDR